MKEDVRAEYRGNLRKLLSLGFGEGIPDPAGKKVLRLSDNAQSLLQSSEEDVEKRLGPSGDLEPIQDWAGKLIGAIVRLAGILHLAERIDSPKPWNFPISRETMEGAIDMGLNYLVPHAQAAFSQFGIDPVHGDAQAVLRWIDTNQITEFSQRDVYSASALRSRFKSAQASEPALNLLEDHGYIRLLRSEVPKARGRPRGPRYGVNPNLGVDWRHDDERSYVNRN